MNEIVPGLFFKNVLKLISLEEESGIEEKGKSFESHNSGIRLLLSSVYHKDFMYVDQKHSYK